MTDLSKPVTCYYEILHYEVQIQNPRCGILTNLPDSTEAGIEHLMLR